MAEAPRWDEQKSITDLHAAALEVMEQWRQHKQENDAIAAAEPVPMTGETPDYTTMSGAEFQRAVGVDPEKWAEAFLQVTSSGVVSKPGDPAGMLIYQSEYHAAETPAARIAFIARWFADAMDAARLDGMRLVFSGVTGKTVLEGE